MPRKTSFSIDCHYPLNNKYRVMDDKLAEIAKQFKGKETGAGAGFGERDISFQFYDINNARKFYKKAEKLVNRIDTTIDF